MSFRRPSSPRLSPLAHSFTCLSEGATACICASPCLHTFNRSNGLKSSPPLRSLSRASLYSRQGRLLLMLNNRRMQPADGFQYDGGPMNGAHGHQIPAGSRLNQYLANNSRQGPSFGPGTPINVNAPVFVPKHQQQQPTPPQAAPLLNPFAQLAIHDVPHQMIPFTQVNAGPQPYGPIPHLNQRQQHHPPPPMQQPPPPQQTPQPTPYDRYQQESRGGTIYFYPDAGEPHPEEEQYAEAEIPEGTVLVATPGAFVYSAPLPMAHMARFRGKANANLQTQFISPELRVELLNRQLAFETKVDPAYYTEIPQAVEHYSNLVPLEATTIQNQSQSTYKAFSCRDGNFYCLRRIHGHRVQHPGKQTHAIEQWKKIVHGNVVPLREILINCRAFEDSSLIFVYDYYPLAETLMARHFDCKSGTFYDQTNGFKLASPMTVPLPVGGSGISETILWTYIVQIAMALRAIHTSGLACRSVDLNKIVSYGNKVLLSFCGIQDLINPDPHSIQHNQNEDLIQFGNIIIALASGRPNGWRRDLMQGSMKHIHDVYSLDLRNVIGFLLNTNSSARRTINEIMPMIGARFFSVIEHMQMKSDQQEAELTRELENGRLFRLLAKMNTVLERVEHGADEAWSETGDRFMLKLFRDYVFHQVTDQGKAWLDMAHIIQCLNKLDSGSMEKIEMVSRNGETQIIIDYNTLKRCLDKSFRELLGTNMMHRH